VLLRSGPHQTDRDLAGGLAAAISARMALTGLAKAIHLADPGR